MANQINLLCPNDRESVNWKNKKDLYLKNSTFYINHLFSKGKLDFTGNKAVAPLSKAANHGHMGLGYPANHIGNKCNNSHRQMQLSKAINETQIGKCMICM